MWVVRNKSTKTISCELSFVHNTRKVPYIWYVLDNMELIGVVQKVLCVWDFVIWVVSFQNIMYMGPFCSENMGLFWG